MKMLTDIWFKTTRTTRIARHHVSNSAVRVPRNGKRTTGALIDTRSQCVCLSTTINHSIRRGISGKAKTLAEIGSTRDALNPLSSREGTIQADNAGRANRYCCFEGGI